MIGFAVSVLSLAIGGAAIKSAGYSSSPLTIALQLLAAMLMLGYYLGTALGERKWYQVLLTGYLIGTMSMAIGILINGGKFDYPDIGVSIAAPLVGLYFGFYRDDLGKPNLDKLVGELVNTFSWAFQGTTVSVSLVGSFVVSDYDITSLVSVGLFVALTVAIYVGRRALSEALSD